MEEIKEETSPVELDTFDETIRKLEEEGMIKFKEHAIELQQLIEKINMPITSEKPDIEIERRDYITKVKTIAMSILGKHPLTNTIDLSELQKIKMNKECQNIIASMSLDEITKKFNDIVCTEVFTPSADYSKFAIYQI